MIILITLALVAVLCFVLLKTYDGYGDWDVLFAIGCVAGVIFLFIGLVSIPLNRMGVRDELVQIEAIRSTKPQNEMQDAAWRMKAADANAELASLKYWNHTTFDVWIPDDVDSAGAL